MSSCAIETLGVFYQKYHGLQSVVSIIVSANTSTEEPRTTGEG